MDPHGPWKSTWNHLCQRCHGLYSCSMLQGFVVRSPRFGPMMPMSFSFCTFSSQCAPGFRHPNGSCFFAISNEVVSPQLRSPGPGSRRASRARPAPNEHGPRHLHRALERLQWTAGWCGGCQGFGANRWILPCGLEFVFRPKKTQTAQTDLDKIQLFKPSHVQEEKHTSLLNPHFLGTGVQDPRGPLVPLRPHSTSTAQGKRCSKSHPRSEVLQLVVYVFQPYIPKPVLGLA